MESDWKQLELFFFQRGTQAKEKDEKGTGAEFVKVVDEVFFFLRS